MKVYEVNATVTFEVVAQNEDDARNSTDIVLQSLVSKRTGSLGIEWDSRESEVTEIEEI